ncbi:hypothetical protein F5Y17DRAFT_436087 [Xylariaceae sp. FL0594]|nr:hypothetical protein F5Y17DRAFT_436087 [Xylariaceae sp. FL0594]
MVQDHVDVADARVRVHGTTGLNDAGGRGRRSRSRSRSRSEKQGEEGMTMGGKDGDGHDTKQQQDEETESIGDRRRQRKGPVAPAAAYVLEWTNEGIVTKTSLDTGEQLRERMLRVRTQHHQHQQQQRRKRDDGGDDDDGACIETADTETDTAESGSGSESTPNPRHLFVLCDIPSNYLIALRDQNVIDVDSSFLEAHVGRKSYRPRRRMIRRKDDAEAAWTHFDYPEFAELPPPAGHGAVMGRASLWMSGKTNVLLLDHPACGGGIAKKEGYTIGRPQRRPHGYECSERMTAWGYDDQSEYVVRFLGRKGAGMRATTTDKILSLESALYESLRDYDDDMDLPELLEELVLSRWSELFDVLGQDVSAHGHGAAAETTGARFYWQLLDSLERNLDVSRRVGKMSWRNRDRNQRHQVSGTSRPFSYYNNDNSTMAEEWEALIARATRRIQLLGLLKSAHVEGEEDVDAADIRRQPGEDRGPDEDDDVYSIRSRPRDGTSNLRHKRYIYRRRRSNDDIDYDDDDNERPRAREKRRRRTYMNNRLGTSTSIPGDPTTDENQRSLNRVAYLGGVLLPFSVVSGILAIQEPFGPGNGQFWIFWAVTIPLTLVILGVIYADSIRKAEVWIEVAATSSSSSSSSLKSLSEKAAGSPSDDRKMDYVPEGEGEERKGRGRSRYFHLINRRRARTNAGGVVVGGADVDVDVESGLHATPSNLTRWHQANEPGGHEVRVPASGRPTWPSDMQTGPGHLRPAGHRLTAWSGGMRSHVNAWMEGIPGPSPSSSASVIEAEPSDAARAQIRRTTTTITHNTAAVPVVGNNPGEAATRVEPGVEEATADNLFYEGVGGATADDLFYEGVGGATADEVIYAGVPDEAQDLYVGQGGPDEAQDLYVGQGGPYEARHPYVGRGAPDEARHPYFGRGAPDEARYPQAAGQGSPDEEEEEVSEYDEDDDEDENIPNTIVEKRGWMNHRTMSIPIINHLRRTTTNDGVMDVRNKDTATTTKWRREELGWGGACATLFQLYKLRKGVPPGHAHAHARRGHAHRVHVSNTDRRRTEPRPRLDSGPGPGPRQTTVLGRSRTG